MAHTHLQAAQTKQKLAYDKTAVTRIFLLGDRVLVRALLFPRQATKEWEGPFTITKAFGPLTYEVRCGPRLYRLKIIHVNHLKWWYGHEDTTPTIA